MLKINIIMVDGTDLKDISIFKNKELADSIVSTKAEIIQLLNFENSRIVYFSGKHDQGGLIPQKILEYEFIDDEKDVGNKLKQFINDNSSIYDLNDTCEFIMLYREQLLNILK